MENNENTENSQNFFASQSVPVQPTTGVEVSPADNDVSRKSRCAALLLGIFVGTLGIHNFYLGRIKRGVAQCVLYVLGFIIYMVGIFSAVASGDEVTDSAPFAKILVPLVIFMLILMGVGIWAFVEWILIAAGKARDGQGKQVLTW